MSSLPSSGKRVTDSAGDKTAKRQKQDGEFAAVVDSLPTPAKNGGAEEVVSVSDHWRKEIKNTSVPLELEVPTDMNAVKRGSPNVNTFANELRHFYNNALPNHVWPDWLKPENLKDGQGNRPEHPSYDQSTVWVPTDKELDKNKDLTPMLKQYWKVKRNNFDKIALY